LDLDHYSAVEYVSLIFLVKRGNMNGFTKTGKIPLLSKRRWFLLFLGQALEKEMLNFL
jgi:hypothetical protein